jgi:glycosyltransferase involved in cell wall biosynthesis
MRDGMRLMLVTDAVGGVWTYSLDLARALREWDIDAFLAITGPSPSARQCKEANEFELIDTGLPLDWTARRPDLIRRAGCALAKLATSRGADLVQTNSAALLADCEFDQPVVAVQHSCVASWWATVKGTPLPPDFLWRRDLIECGLNQAAAVVAPSAAFAALTARTYALTRPIHAVHNGRLALSIKRRPMEDFVFTAGRLWDEGKNLRTLDQAAACLSVPIEAAGPLEGPNGAAIEFENLRCLGEMAPDGIAERLAGRPIFASAALYEPFGLSVLEAAQAGCALVLSDIASFRELWGACAIFVPAGDPQAFINAIGQLLANPGKRTDLGIAARMHALRYTPAAMAQRMVQVYEGLLPQPAPRPAASASALSQLAGAA